MHAIYPDVPVIGFPKGAGVLYEPFARETGVAAVSIDTTVPLDWAARALQQSVAVQGNLDPVLLLTGGEADDRGGAGYPRQAWQGAVRVQSRPWRAAADAARACRRTGRLRARGQRGMSRIAVVLFNLGGPDSPAAVKPFLRNLFSDPAIIAAPGPVRWLLARLISSRRAPVARDIYAKIGGRSPILELTRAQATALAAALHRTAPEHDWHVAVAMRYWHPFAAEAAREVAAFAPERVVLLPLYPQYLDHDHRLIGRGLDAELRPRPESTAPTATVCCYPDAPGFVAAMARLTAAGIADARTQAPGKRLRVLFSAHGLPRRVIASGDPYQWQVERSVTAIVEALRGSGTLGDDVETVICYQSRVGPLEWIGPATDAEIARAGGRRPCRGGGAGRVRVRAFRNPGRTRHRVPASRRKGGRARLRAGAGGGRRHRLHRWRWPACGGGRGRPGRHPVRRRKLRRIKGLSAIDAAAARCAGQAYFGNGITTGGHHGRYPDQPLSLDQGAARHQRDRLDGGMLYLPRLFVYHADAPAGSERSEMLKVMERRLLRGIMNPAMIATLVFGGLLLATPGVIEWQDGWIHVKLALVAVPGGAAHVRGALAQGLRGRPQPPAGALLPHHERGADGDHGG